VATQQRMNGFANVPAWKRLLHRPEFGAICWRGARSCLFLHYRGRCLHVASDGHHELPAPFRRPIGLSRSRALFVMIAARVDLSIGPWSVLLGWWWPFRLCYIGGGNLGSHSLLSLAPCWLASLNGLLLWLKNGSAFFYCESGVSFYSARFDYCAVYSIH